MNLSLQSPISFSIYSIHPLTFKLQHAEIKQVKTEESQKLTNMINCDGFFLNAFQNLHLVWFIQSRYSSMSFIS
jgi:hypothetical protein